MIHAQPEELGFSSERLERINDFMERYVEEGKVAGFITLVARRGRIAFFDKYGYQDLASKTQMQDDTIFRIYSMSKPITSVAFMMLFERGLVRLEDPVSKYIPAFKEAKVYEKGGKFVELEREITIHDLMRHTAGLSYGGIEESKIPADKFYDQANLFQSNINLKEMVQRIASLPLAYQPRSVWHYSVATDVIGHLIEIIAEQALDEFLDEKIFSPLAMVDTGFRVPSDKSERFSTLFGTMGKGDLEILDEVIGGDYFNVSLFLGGSGLVSTTSDYLRFAQMLLNEGELEGVRLLGPKTIQYMTMNHVPLDLLPISMGEPWPGFGFGLGVSVMLDPAQAGMMGSPGLFGWGGWANTHFWIDKKEKLIGILMLQYIPSGTYPVTNDFRTAVYQAIMEPE